MSHHRRQQRYLIERIPTPPHSNRKHVRIHDRRTRKRRDFYAEEFVSGQMHYDERTANYPNYVHDEVRRLCE